MKTLNELYEGRHTKEVVISERKTLNDLFEAQAKEKENAKKEKKTSPTQPVKRVVYTKKKTRKKSGIWYEIEAFFLSFTNAEKAITVTLFIMFCLVIAMLAVQLHNREKEIMIEMSHIDDLPPEDIKNDPKELEEPTKTQNNKVTLSAYNESDMKLQHSEEAFKTLDEILEEREMQEANSELLTSNSPKSDLVLPTEMLDKEQKLKKQEDVVNKNALVKYSLTDRTLRGELPNPIFTCERYGKVVVIIKVNENGYVIEATIDKANSTTSDGCMLDNALKYAQQTQFNVASGRGVQVGSITYSFQQKR
ncbi:hypothetical protein [Capnocytophaga sp.]|uniref:hypothetical protein n=1 Tax=Capnocytophaga sp. TaxID=44737 RepID=UPI0026DC9085|nr:hypothetical protein [Capnocytophaga sp.]MDO5105755.1 hypothetical protein [Capnocytophaga sp.]